MNPETMRRLAFIRYMYGIGVQQSRMPEPLSPVSVLSFHDAVELLLQLAVEHKNIQTDKRMEFIKYWDAIPNLTQRQGMHRLNESRKGLKHHGTFPSQLDIESHRGTATSFFEENTPAIFGVDFRSVSLADFVKPAEAAENLKVAERALASGELSKALLNIRLAFDLMLREYEKHEEPRSGRPPLAHIDLPSSFFINSRGSDEVQRLNSQMSTFVDNVKKAMETIGTSLRILALGLDYRRYSRFQYLVPRAYSFNGEARMAQPPFTDITKDEVQSSFDFVIESAIELYEM